MAAQFSPVTLGNFNATFSEASITPALPFTPSIVLSGLGANLNATTSATVLTSPATGNPQFSVPFTVTTTVTPGQCNTGAPSCIPTGTVQFFVGTTPVGIPVALDSSGAASTSISGQNVGPVTVTAVYSGDDFYGSSTAPGLNITVTTGAANAVVTLSSASLPQFQALTISARLSSATGGIPTGTVTFLADGQMIGAATLNAAGVASINDPQLTDSKGNTILPVPTPNSFGLFAGTHAITAVYGGDTNYNKSTSPAVTLTIQPDAPSFVAYFISPTTQGQVNSLATGTAQGFYGARYGHGYPEQYSEWYGDVHVLGSAGELGLHGDPDEPAVRAGSWGAGWTDRWRDALDGRGAGRCSDYDVSGDSSEEFVWSVERGTCLRWLDGRCF